MGAVDETALPEFYGFDPGDGAPEPPESQPREHPVLCGWCRHVTWNRDAVCDRPACRRRERRLHEDRARRRTTRTARAVSATSPPAAHAGAGRPSPTTDPADWPY